MPAVAFNTRDAFEFFHILHAGELEKLAEKEMTGALHLPSNSSGSGPFPAVVQLHGSFGWRAHHNKHRDNLVKNGFAVLQVDSFKARGVQSTAERQIDCTLAMQVFDAYQGLLFLQSSPEYSHLIDITKVGIAGWSLGGGAAIYSAVENIAAACAGQDGPRFAAHCGVYPAAMYLTQGGGFSWRSAPIVSLVGEDDDYSPSSAILHVTEMINKEWGGNASVVQYPGSHHAFDNITEPVKFNPDYKAMKTGPGGVLACFVDIHANGLMNVTGAVDCPYNTLADRLAHGHKICQSGATVGGNPDHGPKAFDDVLSFFKANLMGANRGAKL